MVHDAERCGEYKVAKLARWEEIYHPLLNVVVTDIEAWRYHATFVDSADQLNNNFARSVVIHDRKLANVSLCAQYVVRWGEI